MFFGISAMILVGCTWTVSGYVMGKAPREKIEIPTLLTYAMGSALLLSCCIGLHQGLPQTTLRGLVIACSSQILSGFFNFFQLEWMSKAMQKGHNGIVWSIIQAGFVFPFFMGIVFFGVPLTGIRLGAFAAALLSVALFGIAQGSKSSHWLIPALGGFLMTGISQALSNLPSYFPEAEAVSSVWRTAALACGFLLAICFYRIFQFKSFVQDVAHAFRQPGIWKYTGLMVGLETLANYFLLFPGMDALSRAGAGAVAYPLMVSACLLAFDLFSLLWLKEKHRFIQWTALALCLAGVTGLSLG